MVEGGPKVAAAFLAADLIDEAVLLRAPMVIGAEGIDALHDQPLAALTRSRHLVARDSERLGPDLCQSFERI